MTQTGVMINCIYFWFTIKPQVFTNACWNSMGIAHVKQSFHIFRLLFILFFRIWAQVFSHFSLLFYYNTSLSMRIQRLHQKGLHQIKIVFLFCLFVLYFFAKKNVFALCSFLIILLWNIWCTCVLSEFLIRRLGA